MISNKCIRRHPFLLVAYFAIFCVLSSSDQSAGAQSNNTIQTLSGHPNGVEIALGTTSGVEVYNTNTQTTVVLPSYSQQVISVSWSPDGAFLAAVGYPHEYDATFLGVPIITSSLMIWERNPNSSFSLVQQIDYSEQTNVVEVSWSPDGSKLATRTSEFLTEIALGNIQVWDVTTFPIHQISQLQGLYDSWYSQIIWSPDSTQIVAGAHPICLESRPPCIFGRDDPFGDMLFIFDAITGERLYYNLSPFEVQGISWSPITNQIIAIADSLQIFSSDLSIVINEATYPVYGVEWSPDGDNLIIWNSSEVQVIESTTLDSIYTQTYTSSGYSLTAVSLNPTGDTLALATDNNGLVTTTVPLQSSTCNATVQSTSLLINSINTANNTGTPYTICLEDSVYTFSTADNSNPLGANALPVITGEIKIIGNGATITRDASAPDFRFFRVADGANLTLENLTLSNGESVGNGGAIYNAGTVTLTNATLDGNQAAYEGGAIFNDSGDILTVLDSTFSNNIVVNDDGGAIDNHGTLSIAGSTFSNNQTLTDDGGAIWTDTGTTLDIADSTFIGNSAADAGGAIMSFGTVTITGETRFEQNNATTSGGAISADTGSITITGGDFIQNSATNDDGGAIVSFAPVTLHDVSFDDNSAGDKGGAIDVEGTTLLVDNGSQFLNNHATDNGGAIYTSSSSGLVNITDSTFTGNTSLQYGGAIYFQDGIHSISTSNFNLNTATQRGGAIYSDATLTINDNSVFDSNQSSDDGGAIAALGTINISNSTFTGNSATDQGGAFRGFVSASSALVNSCIYSNSAGNTSGVFSADANFNATGNWWGASDGPSGDGTGNGDAVNWGVDFANFVTVDCQTALNQGGGSPMQMLNLSPQENLLSSENSTLLAQRSPYTDNFDDGQSAWFHDVRWSLDASLVESGFSWRVDTSVRGQASVLEMSSWIELRNQNRVQLRYREQAQLASVDFVTIQLQTQGSSEWVTLAQHLGGTFTWQDRSLDLVAYRGQTIRLRWVIDVPADQPVGENSQFYALDTVEITHQR